MIKAILFDFDGVLTIDKTGSTTITNYISRTCGIPIDKVKTCYYKYNKQLLLGETTHSEIWADLCSSLERDIDYCVLVDSFKATRLDDLMIALVQKLKDNYLIGMITDNKCDRIDTILEHKGLAPYFDVIAISAQLHSGKESHRIFEYVLDNLKVSAEECVFIDNTEKNLIIPKQMGIKTILFDDTNRSYDSFLKSLESIIH